MLALATEILASCGGKKSEQTAQANDSTTVETTIEDNTDGTAEMQKALETKDPTAFEKAYNGAMDKVKDFDGEKAKSYLATVQQFLKDNTDKIKETVGSNAILMTAIDKVKDLKGDALDTFIKTKADANAVGEKAEDAVKQAGEDAEKKMNEAQEKAKTEVNNAVEKGKQEVSKGVDKAVGDVKGKLGL